jgi:nicotinamide-nucleotide amidase
MTNAIEKAAQLLIENELTIAFAESATAGKASSEFSFACNAGKFLKGAFVCYDAALKIRHLNVPEEIIEEYTPESMEVTKAIADGLGKLIDADILIGITGLPCSGGSETPEKPVGTMFIYAILKGRPWFSERLHFEGTHLQILDQTIERIAHTLCKMLSNNQDTKA